MHKLFYNKFIIFLYMFRALFAHHQEVKIVLYSIWYRHTSRWPSRAWVERGPTRRGIYYTYYTTICTLSWLITKITLRCTVRKTPKDSTYFGQFLCPSSRVFFTVHTAMVYVIQVLLAACEQNQDGTAVPSWFCSQAVWHIPLLCVQWKTPDGRQRNCPETCRVLFQK